MFNWISRIESLLTNSGPWWWRPVGWAISVVGLLLVYWILS